MPKGPQGQNRPADVIGAAIRVARIATGEETETLTRKKGSAGGAARATKLDASKRREIAKKAAAKRWEEEKAVSRD